MFAPSLSWLTEVTGIVKSKSKTDGALYGVYCIYTEENKLNFDFKRYTRVGCNGLLRFIGFFLVI